MAQEFGILAELGIARRGLDGYQVVTSTTERHALHALGFNTFKRTFEYAGGEI